eukprot:jgi/Ulvmu1/7081/UM033_0142.1
MDRQATGIAQLLQRIVADAAAIDLEALTVQRGRWSWVLRLDIHVLSHSGNLTDCALLATVASLCAFRLPQTEISAGGEVVVFAPEEREPLPLTVQHVPIAMSFALFVSGDVAVTDPTREESASAEGSMTLVATEHGELCGVHKVEGCATSPDVIMRCVRLAISGVPDLAKDIREALRVHEVARVHSRVRRVGGGGAAAVPGSTAAAAEEVRAARERAAPPSRGAAVLPRVDVVLPSALPAAELPPLAGLEVAAPAAAAAEPPAGDAAVAPAVPGAAAQGPVPSAASPSAQEPVLMDEGGSDDDHQAGLGVRIMPRGSSGGPVADVGQEADAAAGRRKSEQKKGKGVASRKRCSPGLGSDGFEELAGRIGTPGGAEDGVPTLAASVRTPRKKKKARGTGKGSKSKQ